MRRWPTRAGVVQDVGELDAATASLPTRVKTLLIGRPRDLDRSARLSPCLADRVSGMGRAGSRRSLFVLLRTGRGVSSPRRTSLPGDLSVVGDGYDGPHHLHLLQPYHRGVSQRRRRLSRGIETVGTSCRRCLGLGAAGRLCAHDHRIDCRRRQCPLRSHSARVPGLEGLGRGCRDHRSHRPEPSRS